MGDELADSLIGYWKDFPDSVASTDDHTQRIRDSILKYQNKESDDGSVHSDGTTEG